MTTERSETMQIDYQRISRWGRRAALVFIIALSAPMAACSDHGVASGQQTVSVTDKTVLATIGNQTITLADMQESAGADLEKLEIQYARARSKVIDAALQAELRERLFRAESRASQRPWMSFLPRKPDRRGSMHPKPRFTNWYAQNKSRFPVGRSTS